MYVFSKNGAPFCGGTLLSSDTVLTAAHCKDVLKLSPLCDVKVAVGMIDWSDTKDDQYISVREWIEHPDYTPPPMASYDNDYAIVKLAKHVTFSDLVAPACLPNTTQNYDDVSATISGWGRLYTGAPPQLKPKVLQKVIICNITSTSWPWVVCKHEKLTKTKTKCL